MQNPNPTHLSLSLNLNLNLLRRENPNGALSLCASSLLPCFSSSLGFQKRESKIQAPPLWMVEISSSSNFMRPLFRSGASAAFAFSFGSCKEGWYYRCLGLDPWISQHPYSVFCFSFLFSLFFFLFSIPKPSFLIFRPPLILKNPRLGRIICFKIPCSFWGLRRCCCTSRRRIRSPRATGSWLALLLWEAPARSASLSMRTSLSPPWSTPLSKPMRVRVAFRFSGRILMISSSTAPMLGLMVRKFETHLCFQSIIVWFSGLYLNW